MPPVRASQFSRYLLRNVGSFKRIKMCGQMKFNLMISATSAHFWPLKERENCDALAPGLLMRWGYRGLQNITLLLVVPNEVFYKPRLGHTPQADRHPIRTCQRHHCHIAKTEDALYYRLLYLNLLNTVVLNPS
jgi:hypothetical protein